MTQGGGNIPNPLTYLNLKGDSQFMNRKQRKERLKYLNAFRKQYTSKGQRRLNRVLQIQKFKGSLLPDREEYVVNTIDGCPICIYKTISPLNQIWCAFNKKRPLQYRYNYCCNFKEDLNITRRKE